MKKTIARGFAAAAVAAVLITGPQHAVHAAQAPAVPESQGGVPVYVAPGSVDLGGLLGQTTGLPETVLGPIYGLQP